MADAFVLVDSPFAPPARAEGKLRVLVTGAAGTIGSYFVAHAEGRYEFRLLCHDKDGIGPIERFGEVVIGDVTRLDDCKRACEGMEVVLHLAADASPQATWDSLLPVNIGGAYNMLVAAKSRGVRRFVYASSIHAISGYPRDRQVQADDPVNPGDLYGVSKCFGEAMCRYMAQREGLACIAVRIGAFQPLSTAQAKDGHKLIDAFVSERDMNQLLQRAVEAEHLKFAIVHGLSDNGFNRMDINGARTLLGYAPQDDLTKLNPALATLKLREGLADHRMTDPAESGIREDL